MNTMNTTIGTVQISLDLLGSKPRLYVNDLNPDRDSWWRDPVWVGEVEDAANMHWQACRRAHDGYNADEIEDLFLELVHPGITGING